MITSQERLTSAISSEVLSESWKTYFRELYSGEVHNELLESYKAMQSKGFTKKQLAKKLNVDPAQITRWLSAPSNLTIESISDIALAMGLLPKLRLEKMGAGIPSQNVNHWAKGVGLPKIEATQGYMIMEGNGSTTTAGSGSVKIEQPSLQT